MDVKTLIDDANKFADKAIKHSELEAKARSFRAWLKEPVVVYRLHLLTMTTLLFLFIGYEILNY
tara:strand:- start:313 stop:504 length:192 start_codon:yes stop_codon:yes gene_type:complete